LPEVGDIPEEETEPREPAPEAVVGTQEQRVAGDMQEAQTVAEVEQAVKDFGTSVKKLESEIEQDKPEPAHAVRHKKS
jgi:uncharacterized protein YoxC